MQDQPSSPQIENFVINLQLFILVLSLTECGIKRPIYTFTICFGERKLVFATFH